jgi:hypothetical protein
MTVDIPVEIWAVVQVEMREVPVLQVRVAVVGARPLSSVYVVAQRVSSQWPVVRVVVAVRVYSRPVYLDSLATYGRAAIPRVKTPSDPAGLTAVVEVEEVVVGQLVVRVVGSASSRPASGTVWVAAQVVILPLGWWMPGRCMCPTRGMPWAASVSVSTC